MAPWFDNPTKPVGDFVSRADADEIADLNGSDVFTPAELREG